MFVYLITNTINGKRYVGQTRRTLARRWKQHQVSKGCCALNSAIQKYGVENFTIEPICEPPTIELMNEFEKEYIERYCTLVPNGYNLMTGGPAPQHSEETRKKISDAHMGKKASAEARHKMSESRKGKKMSEGSHKALLARNKGNTYGVGHTVSEKHRLILQRPRSEETRLRMSKPKSEEHKQKIGAAHLGMKRSETAIKNMIEAQRARRSKEVNERRLERASE